VCFPQQTSLRFPATFKRQTKKLQNAATKLSYALDLSLLHQKKQCAMGYLGILTQKSEVMPDMIEGPQRL
jgi:hypothetical protein